MMVMLSEKTACPVFTKIIQAIQRHKPCWSCCCMDARTTHYPCKLRQTAPWTSSDRRCDSSFPVFACLFTSEETFTCISRLLLLVWHLGKQTEKQLHSFAATGWLELINTFTLFWQWPCSSKMRSHLVASKSNHAVATGSVPSWAGAKIYLNLRTVRSTDTDS